MDLNRFATHRHCVTIYSRAGLPVASYEVGEGNPGAGPASPLRGFYLIRLQPRQRGLSPLSPEEWDGLVSVLRA